MEREELVRRLSAIRGGEEIVVVDDFDSSRDIHIESVAGDLLHLFRERDDPKAFELLFELCQHRLMPLAQRLTRQIGVAMDPEDLVSSFMARLFVDLRKDRPRVRRFLALAYAAMRNEALNQLRLLRRAQARHKAFDRWLQHNHQPVDPSVAADNKEQEEVVKRLGAVFLSVVSTCFHQLGERDRRILLAREVDALSYDEIAATLELPRGQIGMILKRARERLAGKIAGTFGRVGPAEEGRA